MAGFLGLMIGCFLFVSSLRAQTDHDIYFARSTDGGATWSDPNIRADEGAPGHQGSPCLKVDRNGYVYLTWSDMRSGDNDVYFAKSLDGGFTWTSPNIKVNDQAGGDQGASCHSLDSNGHIYAAWTDRRFPGDSDVYFAKSTDGGSVWTDPNIEITDSQSWAALHVSLDLDPQGSIYVVWGDQRNLNFDIFFAKSVDGGATWTDPNIRVSPSISDDQERPDIAVDTAGNAYVLYDDNSGYRPPICFTKSTDGGSTWTEPVRVDDSTSTNMRTHSAIALDSQGYLYATWWDWRQSDCYIYFAKSVDGGSTWTRPNIQVNDGLRNAEVWMPISMDIDSAGNISVVWSEFLEVSPGVGDYDVYFARSTDGGSSWTSPNVRINDEALGFQHSPSLDIGPDGTIYVAWQDGRNSVGVNEIVSPRSSPSFALLQNHPNPFALATTIQYVIASHCSAVLSIYDISGRLVKTAAYVEQEPGSCSVAWDGKDLSGRQVRPGIYFCRLVVYPALRPEAQGRGKLGRGAGNPALSGAEVPALTGVEVFTASKKLVILR